MANEKTQADVPLIPAEHMAMVEAAIEDVEKNGAIELTEEAWDRIEREAQLATQSKSRQGRNS